MRLLLPNLQPGKTYTVQIRTDDGESTSQWSPAFTFTTDIDSRIPNVPGNRTWVVSGDSFHGEWDAVSTYTNLEQAYITGYEVELVAGATTKVVSVPNKTDGTRIVFDLGFEQNRALFGTPQPIISFRVRAVDNKGLRSAWSAAIQATNPVPAAPTAPVSGVTADTVDGIAIRWVRAADTDITSYRVYVGTTAGFAPSPTNRIFDGNSDNFFYQSSTYSLQYFKIRSVDRFGQESVDLTATGTPVSPFVVDTAAPAVPTGLTATITNNASGIGARAALSWSQVIPAENDLAGFRVRWRKVGDTNYSQTDFSHEDRASVVELQAAHQNYEFQIRSYDWMANYSAWSATVTATSPANAAPAQVTGVASVAGRDSIRYTWTQSTAADLKEYEVTFSTSSTFAAGNITFKTGTAAVLDVGGLTPATTYYMRVRAIDSGNIAGTFSATNTQATLAQLTPVDIGAPTSAEFDGLVVKVDDSIKTYSTEYSVNTSETVPPLPGDPSWSTATPTRNPGDFIWIRTVVTYHDNTTATTSPALLTGNTGLPGADGTDGTNAEVITLTATTQALISPAASGATTPATATVTGTATNTTIGYYEYSVNGAAFSTVVPAGVSRTGNTVTITGSTMTANTIAVRMSKASGSTVADTITVAKVYNGAAGADGTDGTDGRGISSTVVNYTKSTSATVEPTTGWGLTIPATVAGEYLWTRTVITYTSGTPTTTTSYSVSAHGTTGAAGTNGIDGYTVLLTNESHAFPGSTTAALAGSTESTIIAYKGVTLMAASIGSITHTPALPAGITVTPSGSGTTAAKITVSVTTALTAVGGVMSIPITVDGNVFTRTFSWTVARQGATGSTGNTGTSVTAITRYWLRQTAGAGTPATPGNVASPGGSWVTTEPDYLAGTELWMMDRISYSNATYSYTTPAKSSSYAASGQAITTANGKNTNTYATTTPTVNNGGAVGDLWYVRNATTGLVTGIYELRGGSVGAYNWQAIEFADAVVGNLSASSITAGTYAGGEFIVGVGGVIRSQTYSAGVSGFRLDSTGLEINSGSIRASALIGDTLTSSTGKIQIGAGASIVMNGGFLRSNTYGGDVYNAAATAGFFLSDGNLHIPDGNISAKALKAGTISGTNTITLSGADAKIVGTGFSLSGTGLVVTSGSVEAAALKIQSSSNIMPAKYASFEQIPGSYDGDHEVYSFNDVRLLTNPKFGTQVKRTGWAAGAPGSLSEIWMGTSDTNYNISVEPNTTYIVSAYVMKETGTPSASLFMKGNSGTITAVAGATISSIPSTTTWSRIYGTWTSGATDTKAVLFSRSDASVAGAYFIDGIQVENKISAAITPSPWSPPGNTTIDGEMIRTGQIISSATAEITLVTPLYDGSGVNIGFGHPTTITDPDGRPAFSINTAGNAEFSNMLIRGNVIVGVPDGGPNGDTFVWQPVNLLTVTSGSATVTAEEGTFTQDDVGRRINDGGTYINILTTISSVGDLGATAVLSIPASATSTNVSTNIERPARHVSYLKSGNYVEGATGWVLSSDGTAEFRNIVYDSLDGGAIQTDTLRAEALSAGSINAELTISGSFETVTTTYDIAVNTTSGSSSIVRQDATSWSDADIGASVTGTNIPPATTILSYSGSTAVLSSVASATATGSTIAVVRGRKVGISSSGIVLEDASGKNIVNLPTDANEPATFTGSIEATDLFVYDEFRMLGVNNSVGQGAELHLNAGEYSAPAPKVTFSYDTFLARDAYGNNYDPSADGFVNDPAGFCWDDTAKQYCHVFTFFGTTLSRYWGPGNTVLAADGARDWTVGLSNVLGNGNSDYAYGGMKVVGDNFYFFTKNIDTGAWRIQGVTRTGINRSGGPVVADRMLNVAWRSNDYGSMNGHPAFDIYNGDTYVAKLNGSNQIVLYKYTGTNISVAPAFSSMLNTSGGKIASLSVGQFDMGGATYAVVTTQDGSASTRSNYVFLVGASSFTSTSYNFPLANNYNTIGAAWIGTSNNDATGYFRSLSLVGNFYTYTQFAHTNGATTIYVGTKWRNIASTAVGPMSPLVAATIKRRAKTIISTGSSIPNVGGTSPDAASFYMATASVDTASGRLPLPAAGVTSVIASVIPTVGSIIETALPYGTPSKILAGSNLEISGDGFVRTNRLILQSTLDATNLGGNTPALMIGTTTGAHLRIDNNEIIAMSNDTTQTKLFLNAAGTSQMTNIIVTGTVDVDGISTFNAQVNANGSIFQLPNVPTVSTGANVNMNTATNNRLRLVTSSKRFKENIHDAVLDTDTVLALTPKVFQRNDEIDDETGAIKPVTPDSPWYTGFIAEEAEDLGLRGWVTYDADGMPIGFDYMSWTVVLQDLARKHDAEIKHLRAEIASLKSKGDRA